MLALADRFLDEFGEPEELSETEIEQAEDHLDRWVQEWASKHNISSPCVDCAAGRVARRDSVPSPCYTEITELDTGKIVEGDPPIQARPFDETLDEFLSRAKTHYKRARRTYEEHGFKHVHFKQEREHFRYLAAHLIGGFSWAEIADSRTPFRFPAKSSATVTEGARTAAALLGITLPNKPGPRPGSRAPRTRRRIR